jgi:hypothetical protein
MIDLPQALASLPKLTREEQEALARAPDAPPALLFALAALVPAAVLANPSLPLLEVAGEWRWVDVPYTGLLAIASHEACPERLVEAWLDATADRNHPRPLGSTAYGVAFVLNTALPVRLRERVACNVPLPNPEQKRAIERAMGPRFGALLRMAEDGRRAGFRNQPRRPLSTSQLRWLWALGGYAHLLLAEQPECPRELALTLLASPIESIRRAAAGQAQLIAEVEAAFDATHDPALAEGLARNPAASAARLGRLLDFAPELAYPMCFRHDLTLELLGRVVLHPSARPQLLARRDLRPELRRALDRLPPIP